jgi:predicted pyridoxine 5'-phosphate oxidase superfamily flavin-nucleotide-binding protein
VVVSQLEESGREFLGDALHGALGTVSKDGSPYVVPLHFFVDKDYLYWFSDAGCRHSQNIARDPRVSVALWLSTPGTPSRGAYIQSRAVLLAGKNAERAHQVARERLESPQFDSFPAYQIPLGELDEARSSEKRWYFYT